MTIDTMLRDSAADLQALVADLEVPSLDPRRPARRRLALGLAAAAAVAGALWGIGQLMAGQAPPVVTQVPTTIDATPTTAVPTPTQVPTTVGVPSTAVPTTTQVPTAVAPTSTTWPESSEVRYETRLGSVVWTQAVTAEGSNLPSDVMAGPLGGYTSSGGDWFSADAIHWTHDSGVLPLCGYTACPQGAFTQWGDYGVFQGDFGLRDESGWHVIPLSGPCCGYLSQVVDAYGAISSNGRQALVANEYGTWVRWRRQTAEDFTRAAVPWAEGWEVHGAFFTPRAELGVAEGPEEGPGYLWTSDDGRSFIKSKLGLFDAVIEEASANHREVVGWWVMSRGDRLYATVEFHSLGPGGRWWHKTWESADGTTWQPSRLPFDPGDKWDDKGYHTDRDLAFFKQTDLGYVGIGRDGRIYLSSGVGDWIEVPLPLAARSGISGASGDVLWYGDGGAVDWIGRLEKG